MPDSVDPSVWSDKHEKYVSNNIAGHTFGWETLQERVHREYNQRLDSKCAANPDMSRDEVREAMDNGRL